MIPDPHPLNCRSIGESTYYACGVLYEIAAVFAYRDRFITHDGSMISFWATLTHEERMMIKQTVKECLAECSKIEQKEGA